MPAPLVARSQRPVEGPVLVVVLDGVGLGNQDDGDAVFRARTPVMDALDAITAPAGSVVPTAVGLSVSWGEEDQTQMIAPRRQKRRKKRKKGRRQPKEQES